MTTSAVSECVAIMRTYWFKLLVCVIVETLTAPQYHLESASKGRWRYS